jgi:ribose transport system substrate-binding protein
MGQNASSEARSEIAQPQSRLVGSVAYFPERYGESLIPLAIDIIQGKATPPAIFVKHQLVARDNLKRIYPEDS